MDCVSSAVHKEAPLPQMVEELLDKDLFHKLYPPMKKGDWKDTENENEESVDGSPAAYHMQNHPRGAAIIINNEHFTEMPPRPGTGKDEKALRSLFSSLGFTTLSYYDLTASEMRETLEEYAEKNYKKCDCFILAILTHGEKGGMLHGTDDVLINITEIANLYTGQNCPSLAGKPKLFFIQACRGGEFDKPVKVVEQTDSPNLARKTLGEDKTVGVETLLPDQSDFLLSFSTVEGYVSWRNSSFGSWYVKALVEVFNEESHKEHLLDMLTEVNRRVALSQSQSGYKQIPSTVSQLRRKLYFNPGKFENNWIE